MDTWNSSIWEPVRNLTAKLPERLSPSSVHPITWLLKFSQERVTIIQLTSGLLVLSFMSSWQDMFHSDKTLKIHTKFINKSWKILLLSPNTWGIQSQILSSLNFSARIQTQDLEDRIQTWRSINFSMDLTGINWWTRRWNHVSNCQRRS